MISLRASAIKDSFSSSIPLMEYKPVCPRLSIEKKVHDDTLLALPKEMISQRILKSKKAAQEKTKTYQRQKSFSK